MRTLVITNLYPPEFLGGYELACAQMVGVLRDAGHEVRVVTSVSAHADDAAEHGVARVLELPPIYSAARMSSVAPLLQEYFHLLATTVNPANARALGELIEEFRPDVAYVWNILGLGGLGVLALLRHCGLPWVWHVMDVIPRQLCGFGTSGGTQIARELNGTFPGTYIICSSHLLDEIEEGGVALGERVHIVPNWIKGEAAARRADYFRDGKLRIVNASGVLSEEKGTPVLIEAAAVLRDRGYANFSVDIYGREDDPRFRSMLYEHDVERFVSLRGLRTHDELLRLYEDYDVFAFPTWAREPFAFVALEAAAAGCLPLMSHDCGNAEWMVDNVDCLKAPRSAHGFAGALMRIINREVDLGALARRAQAVVAREFHIRNAAEQVQRILSEAALARPEPRGSAGDFSRFATFAEGLLRALLSEARQNTVAVGGRSDDVELE